MDRTILKRGNCHLPARFWDVRIETDPKVIQQLVDDRWFVSKVIKGATK